MSTRNVRPFVHLRVLSSYSLGAGLSTPADVCQHARRIGFDAVALTDVGGTHGFVEFHRAAREVEGVSPKYETLPGWKEATSGRRLEDLPRPAVEYIRHLEHSVACPIHLVSLGPERSAMVRIPRGPASVRGA